MKNNKPLILISNDDGYRAKGIQCLVDMVKDFGDVIVCAPNSGRSGSSRAFTVTDSLRLIKRHVEPGVEMWSCTGTPVDCVKIALSQLCDRTPDLVIGGINHGDNASVNTHYSGTMGVTMEGCMKYIPSIAFSICTHISDPDFEPMRPYVRDMVKRILEEGLPKGICLNVNFPVVEKYEGVKVCRMAFGTWGNEIEKRTHPRGYDYYWMVGDYTNDEPDAEDTDNWAVTHGYVAITPTKMDVTAYEMMDRLKTWYR